MYVSPGLNGWGKHQSIFLAQVYSQSNLVYLSVSQILFLDLQSVVRFLIEVVYFTLNVDRFCVNIDNT